jgi:tRNA pseudouridine55 synthase
MGRRRSRGRSIDGVILLDKPSGISSNDAVQRVKRLYGAAKVGHTGSLDPLASGMLPLCLGEATKVSGFLLDANKRYHVVARLGVRTTTADVEGEVISELPVPALVHDDVDRQLDRFRGQIEQIPPMYSALKHNGERLYKLARQGVEVERAPRPVTIHSLDLIALDGESLTFAVHCSKGTYVRTLAEDIGEMLGCGAHVIDLRRTAVEPYDSAGMVTIDHLESVRDGGGHAALDQLLLPIDTALQQWPSVTVLADAAFYLGQGQPVLVPRAPTSGLVRVYGPGERFLGVGGIDDDGRVAPRRWFAR